MRALVTGAAGFIGAHVVAALADSGAQVRAFDLNPPRFQTRCDAVEFVRGDVLDPDAVRRAVEGCDTVFHLAAVYSYARSDAALMATVNVDGTRTVLDVALRGKRRRIVYTSSCATCGPVAGRRATERDLPPPQELGVPYKRTKLEAERLSLKAAHEGADVIVLNPTVPVGPGDLRPTPTGKMVADVAEGRARAYLANSGLNIVAVEDVARGHVCAFERGRSGERYLLGGEDISVRDAFAVIASAAGLSAPRLPVPWIAAYAGAWVTDAVLRVIGREPQLLVLDEVRSGRLPHLFNDAKARAELGYVSRPAVDALRDATRSALARHDQTDRSATAQQPLPSAPQR
jgi:dihydroflavonol-4-reductase